MKTYLDDTNEMQLAQAKVHNAAWSAVHKLMSRKGKSSNETAETLAAALMAWVDIREKQFEKLEARAEG